jgi:hypothetical protein
MINEMIGMSWILLAKMFRHKNTTANKVVDVTAVAIPEQAQEIIPEIVPNVNDFRMVFDGAEPKFYLGNTMCEIYFDEEALQAEENISCAMAEMF